MGNSCGMLNSAEVKRLSQELGRSEAFVTTKLQSYYEKNMSSTEPSKEDFLMFIESGNTILNYDMPYLKLNSNTTYDKEADSLVYIVEGTTAENIKSFLTQNGYSFTESTIPKQGRNFTSLVVDNFKEQNMAMSDRFNNPESFGFDIKADPLKTVQDLGFTKMVQLKENRINAIKRQIIKLNEIRRNKGNSQEAIKEANKEYNALQVLLYGTEFDTGLIGELEQLKERTKITENRLEYYFSSDIARLDSLIGSNDIHAIQEVTSTLNFYSTLDIDNDENLDKNPFLTRDELVDEQGNSKLSESMQELFRKYATLAKQYEIRLNNMRREVLMDTVNTNSKSTLTFDEITHAKDGFKDASWVDMFLMDGQNGIFSKNPELRQMMQKVLEQSMNDKLMKAKAVEMSVDSLQGKVQQVMKSLGYGLNSMGLGGIDYSLFRAKDKFGFMTKQLVSKFNTLYSDAERELNTKYSTLIKTALKEEDAVKRKELLKTATKLKNAWLRENTEVLNIDLLTDVTGEASTKETEEYKQKLISLYGQRTYNEAVKEQKARIKAYTEQKAAYLEELLVAENISDPTMLSKEAQQNLEIFTKRESPMEFSKAYHNFTVVKSKNTPIRPNLNNTVYLPKVFKSRVAVVNGKHTEISSEVETGYINKDFSKIENNPVLLEFYDVLKNVFDDIYHNIPIEDRGGFTPFDIHTTDKSLQEILITTQGGLNKLHELWKWISDYLVKLFTEKIQNYLSFATVDPITGLPAYKVNSSFLTNNQETINNLIDAENIKVNTLFGTKELTLRLKTINITDKPAVIDYIADALKITTSQVKAQFDLKKFDMATFIKNKVINSVVVDQSLDLPKIAKYFSKMNAEYSARQEVLPILTLMKEYYEGIQAPALTKQGEPIVNAANSATRLNGVRSKAVRQTDAWFKRAVLGDYDSKSEFGSLQMMNSKKYTTKEKLEVAALDEAITALERNPSEPNLKRAEVLKKRRDSIGGNVTATAVTDALFNWIRFSGLGWNVSSGISNLIEGQLANSIAVGKYIPEEYYNKANNIVKQSWVKSSSAGMIITKDAAKLTKLMEMYDILQDASNELQKASNKSVFNKLNKFAPYELTKRVEYLNQAPVFLSILMDTKIVGKDGTESSVWDAMNKECKLLDNFATEQNRLNWESLSKEDLTQMNEFNPDLKNTEFSDFKNKVSETIVKIHGDYHSLRGNLATEYVTGKAVLGFKRWVSSALFNRFAPEQRILALGEQNFKGRYRSLNAASGTLYGIVLGGIGMGLPGIAFIGALGGAVGRISGNYHGVKSNLSYIQQLAELTKGTFLKFIGVPINAITGKTFIPVGDKSLSSTYSNEQDYVNTRELMTELAFLLACTAVLILIKGLNAGDDDDEKTLSDAKANILANKLIQLSSQTTSYLNFQMVDNMTSLDNIAVARLLNNVYKVAKEGSDAIMGNDIQASGENSGESGFANALSKLTPGVTRGLGFSSLSERQFASTAMDRIFESEEKQESRERKAQRAELRLQLKEENPDVPKEEIEKMVNQEIPNE